MNSQQTALMMLRTHGPQAYGIARQHEAEARQRGDTAELERWQDIELAIAELRRSDRRDTD